jgi:multidrug transporter EmrE-like cation transporter
MNSYIFYSLLFIGLIIEMISYQLLKKKENPRYFALGILCFVFISIILSELFSIKGVIKTHALFDIMSILLSILIGLFITNESLTKKQLLGVFFGILCIILIEFD